MPVAVKLLGPARLFASPRSVSPSVAAECPGTGRGAPLEWPGRFDETSQAAIAGEAGSGPQAYGDDADLDSLYDACDGGDDRACDLLFVNASQESEYWLLAIDCAGRGETDGFCTEGIVAASDGFADASSPGLEVLTVDCEAGDMIACDTLFGIAQIGTTAENTGYTCGGKIAVGAIPNCRTRFPS